MCIRMKCKGEENMLIQIVEDDRALSDGIVLALGEQGTEFVQCTGVKSAEKVYREQSPDLIILDINLPDGSGYDYLKWVRSRADTPVLMLTANDMEMDEVMGLSLGADDYMTKPFSLAVLRARIRVLLRRQQKARPERFEFDGFIFDFGGLIFEKRGQEISLSKNEQRLLRLFLENEGRVLTRSVLVDRLWTDGAEYVDENALSVTINRLRGKLEDKREGITYIQAVYGQGYVWRRERAGE